MLRCPRCPRCRREATLDATLSCGACGHRMAVEDGVVAGMYRPPETVVCEAAGLARFADLMRRDGWDRERILRLPDEPSPYWHGQRTAFAAVLASGRFRPGQRLLDVGANSCWAAAAFARHGLEVARRRPRLRRAYRAWLHHVAGSVPLSFVATKR